MRVLLFFFLIVFSTNTFAQCNFRSAEYIDELSSPAKIKAINIEIAKSSKFSRNAFKILISKNNIPHKLKKNFNALLTVNYDFGFCKYRAKVRQSGDWKDHIKLVKGNPIQSLDVKLKEGNVLGATRFKLLIPETRNGKHEILATLIFRELNFIAPETFEVIVGVNGVQSMMLFQEKAAKELLERNFRREGPIFEGDESLLWSYKQFSPFELEPLALSRLINNNWFEKGFTSQEITLRAFNRLQKAYLDYANLYLKKKSTEFINLNGQEDINFNNYFVLMHSMNGWHGLRPHNRQYYFNSIEDRFEPIYYDGNISFSPLSLQEFPKYFLRSQLSNDLKERLLDLVSSKVVKDRFFERLHSSQDIDFYTKSMNQLISNIKAFSELANSKKIVDLTSIQETTDYAWYIDYQMSKKLSQNIVKRLEVQNGTAKLYLHNRDPLQISTLELSKILKKNEFINERFTIFPNISLNSSEKGFKDIFVANNIVRMSSGVNATIDENNQSITFAQSQANDWVLFLGGDYSNWDISFKGIINKAHSSYTTNQRFNKHGLTGCLTLYNTIIDNSHIKVSDGKCEDSLNLINNRGEHFRVIITNAFADALDADFSKLVISDLEISNAGNDCLDFSGGIYRIIKANLSECNDKAISIGERSLFEAKLIKVKGANIGLSSKDFSQTEVFKFDAIEVAICGEAKQKKQEFGGGFLKIIENNCIGTTNKDDKSLMIEGHL